MKLSIIIPTHNEELIIEQTLKQLHDNLTGFTHEIIVTDDASTDRTVEIAARYAKVVPHVIADGGKRRIGANRNNGAKAAHGDFLAFIDADMFIMNPNTFFEKLFEEFAKDKHILAATVKIKILPQDATLLDNIVLEIMGFLQWFHNNLMRAGSASGEFQMIRRDAFERAHGYRESLPVGEDNDLFMRLSKMGRTRMVWGLTAFTSSRRSRQVGWPKLLWLWTLNYFSVLLFDKSYNQEWPPVHAPKAPPPQPPQRSS